VRYIPCYIKLTGWHERVYPLLIYEKHIFTASLYPFGYSGIITRTITPEIEPAGFFCNCWHDFRIPETPHVESVCNYLVMLNPLYRLIYRQIALLFLDIIMPFL
jgi:hypothetical protein